MTMTTDPAPDCCWVARCGRRPTITIKDGRRYCKQHGDRVPTWQRRTPRQRPATNTNEKETA